MNILSTHSEHKTRLVMFLTDHCVSGRSNDHKLTIVFKHVSLTWVVFEGTADMTRRHVSSIVSDSSYLSIYSIYRF